MNALPADFAPDYEPMLRQFGEGGEVWLHEAYMIGRRALNDGKSVLDIVQLHHEAMIDVGAETKAVSLDGQEQIRRASAFLGECLGPFEMMLRGMRASNTQLMVLNAELEEANAQLQAQTKQRERAEESLRQNQKLQAVGRLAGGVAHHFNNLLTVIMGNLDLLRQTDLAPAKREKRLAAAADAAEHAAKVTRQLLTFSGRQDLRPGVFIPNQRLPELADFIEGSLGAGVDIEFAFAPDLSSVRIDAAELELALLNLCINARDAMPTGGKLRVSAKNSAIYDENLGLDGRYLVIEVADNGPGIPPDILSQVFDPFFTTKGVGVGTGLGLSQVHGFAYQSGGAVDVESAVGLGTTVRLYLPVLIDAEDVADSVNKSNLKIVLVVDDDVDVAEVAAEMLASCGFEVRIAHRALDALDLLKRGEKVDLVFSDIAMPDGMDGIELAKEIRLILPELPIILATGYSESLENGEDQGFNIIRKPYRSKDLSRYVAEMLKITL